MSTDTKFIHYGQAGVPSLAGVIGGLIPVLDTFLVTGTALKSVDSIVVADGVATAHLSGGHGYEATSVVLVAGAPEAALNAEHRVASITAGTVVFPVSGVANGTYNGSITMKLAPLGWEKVFSGTSKAVYRPTDPASSRFYLRVDDTEAATARVRVYEHMTDVDTGVGLTPTDAISSGGYWWPKSNIAGTATRRWFMSGDSRHFYLGAAPHSSYADKFVVNQFGNPKSKRPNDPYGVILTGATSSAEALSGANAHCAGYSSTVYQSAVAFARSLSGLGTAKTAAKFGRAAAAFSGRSDYNPVPITFPNQADNALALCEVELYCDSGIRSILPGVWHAIHDAASNYTTEFGVIDGFGATAGRKLRHVKVGGFNGNAFGVMFLDVTGSWR